MYDPRIDGLRFLAILPVLIFHASLRGDRILAAGNAVMPHDAALMTAVPPGEVGVLLFFFLSGFIIAFPFLRASATARAMPAYGSFYLRRLLRLAPAYVLVLTVCYLALAITGYAPKDAPKFNASDTPLYQSYLASLIYSHNLIFGGSSRILPPLWTLEIEIQFYLFAPLILTAYSMAEVRMRRIAMLIAIIVGLSVGHWPWLNETLGLRHTYSILGYSHFFLTGILVSDLVFGRALAHRAVGDLLFLGGYAVLLSAGTWKVPVPTIDSTLRDVVLLTSIVAIYFGGMTGRLATRFLAWTPISIIGGACYSIYLTHLPVIQAGSEVAKRLYHPHGVLGAWALVSPTVPFAIATGLFFYALVEQPTMKPDWPARLVRRFVPVRRLADGDHSSSSDAESPLG